MHENHSTTQSKPTLDLGAMGSQSRAAVKLLFPDGKVSLGSLQGSGLEYLWDRLVTDYESVTDSSASTFLIAAINDEIDRRKDAGPVPAAMAAPVGLPSAAASTETPVLPSDAVVSSCALHGTRPSPMCPQCQYLRAAVADQVRDRRRREDAAEVPLPDVVGLADLLAADDDEPEYLIADLLPYGGRAVLTADAKAGKTTTRNNLIRALVDGVPFLGEFDVPRAVERVAVLDLELSPRMSRRWLARQGIANPSKVHLIHAVGAGAAFDPLVPEVRARWADSLAGVDVLIIDCLEPLLLGLGLNPWNDGRRLLTAIDSLAAEAGIGSVIVLHHTPNGGNREAGDHGIRGWPDVRWFIRCEAPEDPTCPRYFLAHGRDVAVSDRLLELDSETGHLTARSGADAFKVKLARGASAAASSRDALLAALAADGGDGWTAGQIDHIGKAAGLARDTARGARTAAVRDGLLAVGKATGRSGANIHTLTREGAAAARAAADSDEGGADQ